MVKTTDAGLRQDSAGSGWSCPDGPTGWRVLLQPNVGSVFVIVGNILTPKPSKVGLVERDDMVK